MEIPNEILKLIIKHLSQTSSGADDTELRAWLQQSDEHPREFEKVKRIWRISDKQPFGKVQFEPAWAKFKATHLTESVKPKTPILKQLNPWIKVAAVLVIGLAVSLGVLSRNNTYTTGHNERLQVNLSDGTSILLGENSQLKVATFFNWQQRNVELNGTGFFEIAKNPSKTFTITGAKTNTQILGTRFKLIATTQQNSIEVSEGKVAYWQTGGDTLTLTKAMRGSLSNDGEIKQETINNQQYNNWETGVFSFKNAPIGEVLHQLQDYYGFSLSDTKNLQKSKCLFTGGWSNAPISEVLQELQLTLGLEYSFKDNILTLTQIDCP